MPVTALALTLSGCGYDVEVTSHDEIPDFSDYSAYIIDDKSIKGTYLDSEYREGIASNIRAMSSTLRSKDFALSEDAGAKIDGFISELNEIQGIDMSRLEKHLTGYKGNIARHVESEKRRSELTRKSISAQANPLFVELDAAKAEELQFTSYIISEVEQIAALEKKEKELEAVVKLKNEETNKNIAQYIIDNELPLSVDNHKAYFTFKNEEEFRPGNTCDRDRKAKADFRGTMYTSSTGEKICTYKFHYSIGGDHRFSEEDGKKIHEIVSKGLSENKDNYIKLGLTENQLDEVKVKLKNKTIIAENKFATTERTLSGNVYSVEKKIKRLGKDLFNEDRTINEASRAFTRIRDSRKMRAESPIVKLKLDQATFRAFDSRNDDVYVVEAMKALDRVAHKVEMGSAGFDLPTDVEVQNIRFVMVSTMDTPKSQDSTYLWGHDAFINESELAFDSKIRLHSRSERAAKDVIYSALSR